MASSISQYDWLVELDFRVYDSGSGSVSTTTHRWSMRAPRTVGGNAYELRIKQIQGLRLPYIDRKTADFGDVTVTLSNLANDQSTNFPIQALDAVQNFDNQKIRIYRYNVLTDNLKLIWAGFTARPVYDDQNYSVDIPATFLWDALAITVPAHSLGHDCFANFNGSKLETTAGVPSVLCPYNPGGGIGHAPGTGSASSCDKSFNGANGCKDKGMQDYHQGFLHLAATIAGERNNLVQKSDIRKAMVPSIYSAVEGKYRPEIFKANIVGEELIVNFVVSGVNPGQPFSSGDLVASKVKLGDKTRATVVDFKTGAQPQSVSKNSSMWPNPAGHSLVSMAAARFKLTKEQIDRFGGSVPIHEVTIKLPNGHKTARGHVATGNHVLVLEDALASPAWGLGLPAAEIDTADVDSEAAYNAGRFDGRFEFDAATPLIDFVQHMLASFHGYVTWEAGKLRIKCKRDTETAVATFGTGGIQLIDFNRVKISEARFSEITNQLDVKYRDQYRVGHKFDYIDHGAQWKAGNGTRKAIDEALFLEGIYDKTQAKISAAIWMREEVDLYPQTGSLRCTYEDWEASGAKPGSVVRVNSEHVYSNSSNYLFRVTSPEIDTTDDTVTVGFYSYAAAAYAYNSDLLGDVTRGGGWTSTWTRPQDVQSPTAVIQDVFTDDDGREVRLHCAWVYPDVSALMAEDQTEGIDPTYPIEHVELRWRYTDEKDLDLKPGPIVKYPTASGDMVVPFHRKRKVEVWFIAVGRNHGTGEVGYVLDPTEITQVEVDAASGATSILVGDETVFTVGGYARCETELMKVTAAAAGSITVARAQFDTTAAAHAATTEIGLAVKSHPTVIVDLATSRFTYPIVQNVVAKERRNGVRVKWDDVDRDVIEKYYVYWTTSTSALDSSVPGPEAPTWYLADPETPGAGSVFSFTDTFVRPDSATVGNGWTADSQYSISGNKLLCATPSGGPRFCYQDFGIADFDLTLTVQADCQNSGALFRYTDGSNYWEAIFGGNGSNVSLAKIVAGSVSGPGAINHSITVGDVLKVTGRGADIRVFVNGMIVGQMTDGFNQSATKHGIITAATNPGSHYTNFTIANPANSLSVVVSDDFNRANGSPGAPWIDLEGASVITSNAVHGSTFATYAGVHYAIMGLDALSHEAQVQFTLSPATTEGSAYFQCAYIAGSNLGTDALRTGYFAYVTGNLMAIYRVVNGAYVQESAASFTGYAAGDVFTFTKVGATLYLQRNNGYSCNWTDSAPLTGTQIGWQSSDTSGLDKIVVTTEAAAVSGTVNLIKNKDTKCLIPWEDIGPEGTQVYIRVAAKVKKNYSSQLSALASKYHTHRPVYAPSTPSQALIVDNKTIGDQSGHQARVEFQVFCAESDHSVTFEQSGTAELKLHFVHGSPPKKKVKTFAVDDVTATSQLCPCEFRLGNLYTWDHNTAVNDVGKKQGAVPSSSVDFIAGEQTSSAAAITNFAIDSITYTTNHRATIAFSYDQATPPALAKTLVVEDKLFSDPSSAYVEIKSKDLLHQRKYSTPGHVTGKVRVSHVYHRAALQFRLTIEVDDGTSVQVESGSSTSPGDVPAAPIFKGAHIGKHGLHAHYEKINANYRTHYFLFKFSDDSIGTNTIDPLTGASGGSAVRSHHTFHSKLTRKELADQGFTTLFVQAAVVAVNEDDNTETIGPYSSRSSVTQGGLGATPGAPTITGAKIGQHGLHVWTTKPAGAWVHSKTRFEFSDDAIGTTIIDPLTGLGGGSAVEGKHNYHSHLNKKQLAANGFTTLFVRVQIEATDLDSETAPTGSWTSRTAVTFTHNRLEDDDNIPPKFRAGNHRNMCDGGDGLRSANAYDGTLLTTDLGKNWRLTADNVAGVRINDSALSGALGIRWSQGNHNIEVSKDANANAQKVCTKLPKRHLPGQHYSLTWLMKASTAFSPGSVVFDLFDEGNGTVISSMAFSPALTTTYQEAWLTFTVPGSYAMGGRLWLRATFPNWGTGSIVYLDDCMIVKGDEQRLYEPSHNDDNADSPSNITVDTGVGAIGNTAGTNDYTAPSFVDLG